MAVVFENDWAYYLKEEFNKDYYVSLRKNLINEYKKYIQEEILYRFLSGNIVAKRK